MQTATVRVPASTSNLGPGFDCLGLALRIYNHVRVTRGGPTGPDAMIDETAQHFFRATAAEPFPFSCAITGDVPRTRGLGSSVTVRLGVLAALNALAASPLSREQLFAICVELEGHPDNAAPAMFGGFSVANATARHVFSVAPELRVVLWIPEFEIETEMARRILPAEIPRAGAIASCANACAITAAFAARQYEALAGCFADHLHQPYRERLLPQFRAVIAAGERAGALGGFLSGSGPTIACLALTNADAVGEAMLAAGGDPSARVVITRADNLGTRLCRSEIPCAANHSKTSL